MIYAATSFLAVGFLAGNGMIAPQQNAPTVKMATVRARTRSRSHPLAAPAHM